LYLPQVLECCISSKAVSGTARGNQKRIY